MRIAILIIGLLVVGTLSKFAYAYVFMDIKYEVYLHEFRCVNNFIKLGYESKDIFTHKGGCYISREALGL